MTDYYNRVFTLVNELGINTDDGNIEAFVKAYVSGIELVGSEIEYMNGMFDFADLSENTIAFNMLCSLFGISTDASLDERKELLYEGFRLTYGDFDYDKYLSDLNKFRVTVYNQDEYTGFSGYTIRTPKDLKRFIRMLKSYLLSGRKYKINSANIPFYAQDNLEISWYVFDSLDLPFSMMETL